MLALWAYLDTEKAGEAQSMSWMHFAILGQDKVERIKEVMGVTNIIESISIIIAAWAIFIGVNAWRREYVGKRNLELAEEVLSLFYEAKDVLKSIRSPFGFSGEGSTRKAAPNESPEEKKIYDKAFVTFERYNRRSDLFSKLYSMRYRYMARFGRDSIKPFDDLQDFVNEIQSAADMLTYYWTERASRNTAQSETELGEIRKYESIIWWKASKDVMSPKIEKIISDIEVQSHKILNPRLIDRIRQWFI
ncbi:hypothetical protein ACFLTP_01790 [Chloroflexota bacterium]